MFGPNGRGVAEHFGLEHEIGVSFGTLSKSFGGVGGFVCSNARIIDYLKGYSSPWNFSCSPSPPVVAGLMKALEVATRDSSLRDLLWSNVAYLKKGLLDLKLDLGQERIPGDSHHHRLLRGEAHPVRLRDPEARPVPPARGFPRGSRGLPQVPHLGVRAVHEGADGHGPDDHRRRDRQGTCAAPRRGLRGAAAAEPQEAPVRAGSLHAACDGAGRRSSSILPHREPFLLVDRLTGVSFDEESIAGSRASSPPPIRSLQAISPTFPCIRAAWKWR